MFFADESVGADGSVDRSGVDLNGRVAVEDSCPVKGNRHAGRVFLVRLQNVGRSKRNHFEERNVITFHQDLVLVNLLHGLDADRPVAHGWVGRNFVHQRHHS